MLAAVVVIIVLLFFGWRAPRELRFGPNWLALRRLGGWRILDLDGLESAKGVPPPLMSYARSRPTAWRIRLQDRAGVVVDLPADVARQTQLRTHLDAALTKAHLPPTGALVPNL